MTIKRRGYSAELIGRTLGLVLVLRDGTMKMPVSIVVGEVLSGLIPGV
jgi:hypothetical protein